MSIVLGIDLGANLGYAIGDSSKGPNGTIIECDVVDLAKRAKQLRCTRNTALLVWAREVIKARGVEAYCREGSIEILRQEANRAGRYRQEHSQRNLGLALEHHSGYAAIIEAIAESRGVKLIEPVHPTTLKSWATGNGKAKKPQMTRAAQTLYRVDTDDENACDAAHVCAWAMLLVKQAGRLPF